ncbi:DUF4981 domain-containing protein [Sesbania bispinosa]|nr:DUF4981 domain-containing protein [Sesbania bispinosa]
MGLIPDGFDPVILDPSHAARRRSMPTNVSVIIITHYKPHTAVFRLWRHARGNGFPTAVKADAASFLSSPRVLI